jgi:hypothetical protein
VINAEYSVPKVKLYGGVIPGRGRRPRTRDP